MCRAADVPPFNIRLVLTKSCAMLCLYVCKALRRFTRQHRPDLGNHALPSVTFSLTFLWAVVPLRCGRSTPSPEPSVNCARFILATGLGRYKQSCQYPVIMYIPSSEDDTTPWMTFSFDGHIPTSIKELQCALTTLI